MCVRARVEKEVISDHEREREREQQIKLYVFEDFKRNFVKLFLGQLFSHVKRML